MDKKQANENMHKFFGGPVIVSRVVDNVGLMKLFIEKWDSGQRTFDDEPWLLKALDAIQYMNNGIDIDDLKCCGNCDKEDICINHTYAYESCGDWKFDGITREQREE